jgi:hypothetical protein
MPETVLLPQPGEPLRLRDVTWRPAAKRVIRARAQDVERLVALPCERLQIGQRPDINKTSKPSAQFPLSPRYADRSSGVTTRALPFLIVRSLPLAASSLSRVRESPVATDACRNVIDIRSCVAVARLTTASKAVVTSSCTICRSNGARAAENGSREDRSRAMKRSHARDCGMMKFTGSAWGTVYGRRDPSDPARRMQVMGPLEAF